MRINPVTICLYIALANVFSIEATSTTTADTSTTTADTTTTTADTTTTTADTTTTTADTTTTTADTTTTTADTTTTTTDTTTTTADTTTTTADTTTASTTTADATTTTADATTTTADTTTTTAGTTTTTADTTTTTADTTTTTADTTTTTASTTTPDTTTTADTTTSTVSTTTPGTTTSSSSTSTADTTTGTGPTTTGEPGSTTSNPASTSGSPTTSGSPSTSSTTNTVPITTTSTASTSAAATSSSTSTSPTTSRTTMEPTTAPSSASKTACKLSNSFFYDSKNRDLVLESHSGEMLKNCLRGDIQPGTKCAVMCNNGFHAAKRRIATLKCETDKSELVLKAFDMDQDGVTYSSDCVPVECGSLEIKSELFEYQRLDSKNDTPLSHENTRPSRSEYFKTIGGCAGGKFGAKCRTSCIAKYLTPAGRRRAMLRCHCKDALCTMGQWIEDIGVEAFTKLSVCGKQTCGPMSVTEKEKENEIPGLECLGDSSDVRSKCFSECKTGHTVTPYKPNQLGKIVYKCRGNRKTARTEWVRQGNAANCVPIPTEPLTYTKKDRNVAIEDKIKFLPKVPLGNSNVEEYLYKLKPQYDESACIAVASVNFKGKAVCTTTRENMKYEQFCVDGCETCISCSVTHEPKTLSRHLRSLATETEVRLSATYSVESIGEAEAVQKSAEMKKDPKAIDLWIGELLSSLEENEVELPDDPEVEYPEGVKIDDPFFVEDVSDEPIVFPTSRPEVKITPYVCIPVA